MEISEKNGVSPESSISKGFSTISILNHPAIGCYWGISLHGTFMNPPSILLSQFHLPNAERNPRRDQTIKRSNAEHPNWAKMPTHRTRPPAGRARRWDSSSMDSPPQKVSTSRNQSQQVSSLGHLVFYSERCFDILTIESWYMSTNIFIDLHTSWEKYLGFTCCEPQQHPQR